MEEEYGPNGPEREPVPLPDVSTWFVGYTGEIPLGEPEPVHFDPDRIERLSPCNLNLGDVAPEHQTTNPALVTCALCAATLTTALTDAELAATREADALDSADEWGLIPALPRDFDEFDDHYVPEPGASTGEALAAAAAPHPYVNSIHADLDGYCGVCGMAESELRHAAPKHDGFADLAPQIGPAPAAERTVTVEALTAELREVANAAIVADFRAFNRDPESEPELLPPESRAAVVVRAAGQLEAVTDVETDVPQRNGASALAWLMHQALGRANNLDAELVMPGADVLAALAGQPELQAWTEQLAMRSSTVKVGWLAVGFTAEGAEDLITAVDDCADPDCVWHGECVVISAGTEPVHFATWQTLPVRIPAAVTR